MEAKWSRAIVKLDDWTLLALNVYLTTRVGNDNADSKKKSQKKNLKFIAGINQCS